MGNRINEKNHEASKIEIINSAKKIIQEEGLEGLSIRKIAKNIGYSPSIIYHYFNDKDAIIHVIFFEGYMNLIMAVKQAFDKHKKVDEALKAGLMAYVETANTYASEYTAIMTSTHADIIKHTSVLTLETFEEHLALEMMKTNLEQGIEKNIYAPTDVILTAKHIWSSLFGFTLKTILEPCDDETRKTLTTGFITFIMKSLLADNQEF